MFEIYVEMVGLYTLSSTGQNCFKNDLKIVNYNASVKLVMTMLNNSITFNNKITNTPTHIANCFTKQFTNTVRTK